MKPLIITMMLLVALTSCKKFLDTSPTDFVEPDYYYNNETDLNLALAGCYDPLGDVNYIYGSAIWFRLGICTDEAFYPFSSNSYSAPMFYQFDYTNEFITGLWQKCYVGIERANLLIANIDQASISEDKRQVILGEALFLRAYYHFLLVSNYGDVPLKLTPTDNVNSVDIPRTPAKEVYEQILTDMQAAEQKVSTTTTLGSSSHISKTAVEGVLTRVCLYMAGNPLNDVSKYTDALTWAKKVVASGEHDLLTTYNASLTNSAYSQIFINEAQDIYNTKEAMWEIDFNANGGNSAYAEYGQLGVINGIACTNVDTGYASANVRSTIRLYNYYAANDQRRDWAIAPFTFVTSGSTLTRSPYASTSIIGRACGKWRRYYEAAPKLKSYSGQNFPVLRYGDVLLMLAEAENEVNGPTTTAYDAINQVRRRGYGLPVSTASAVADVASGLSKDQFRTAIREERARELCFEGLRKPDLIRWGIFKQTMQDMVTEINASNASASNKALWTLGYVTASSSDRYLLLPVPSAEISVNRSMTQNPGW